MYTNVVSEARKGARAEEGVREWLFSVAVPDLLSTVDGLMVATVQARGMSFVTRNTDDTVRTDVRLLNLFGPSR